MSTKAISIYYQDMLVSIGVWKAKRERKTLLTGTMPRQLISLVKRLQRISV